MPVLKSAMEVIKLGLTLHQTMVSGAVPSLAWDFGAHRDGEASLSLGFRGGKSHRRSLRSTLSDVGVWGGTAWLSSSGVAVDGAIDIARC